MTKSDSESIHEKLGYIKGKLESIDRRLATQNGEIKDHAKRLSRYDIAFGKIGVMVALITFVGVAVFNTIFDWIKLKWFK